MLAGQKTIFISIYDGDTEKNILRSGVFPQLIASGHRLVLLIRSVDRLQYYRDNFGGPNIEIEPLPHGITRAEIIWNHIDWNTLPTYSVYLRRYDWFLAHRRYARYAVERTLGILGSLRLWRNFLRFVYYATPDRYAHELFEHYHPDLVFAPSMFSAEDCRLLKAAKKRSIPTVTTAKSWDVLTTKAFTRVHADKLLVFNQFNKNEAIAIGDYAPEAVVITGFPQFDAYAREDIMLPRAEFCKTLGLDPQNPFILFAVPGNWKLEFADEVVKHLDDAIEAGMLPTGTRILARVHPKYPSKVESRTDYAHVVVDRPGTYFSAKAERSLDTSMSAVLAWTFTDKDIVHLANSIHHSAVTINIESTMTLDAAAQSKPVILVGYDGDHQLPYWQSIVRNYDREHYKNVVATKGARIAKTKEELIADVKAYLADPTLDQEGRQRLKTELLYQVDGHSSQRVAQEVLAMIAA